jgi:hypothetical protein
MRQLGNAVPVQLAKVVALGVFDRLQRFSKLASNNNYAQRIARNDNGVHCVNGHHVNANGLPQQDQQIATSAQPARTARRRRSNA